MCGEPSSLQRSDIVAGKELEKALENSAGVNFESARFVQSISPAAALARTAGSRRGGNTESRTVYRFAQYRRWSSWFRRRRARESSFSAQAATPWRCRQYQM